MISYNYQDYSSSVEWLADYKQDDVWLDQLQQLQDATPDELREQKQIAIKKIEEGAAGDFWRFHKHNVKKVVEKLWESRELTIANLMRQTGWMLTLEWLEQHSEMGRQASGKPKRTSSKQKPKAKPGGKPMTLKYYTHGNNGVLMKQRRRVDILFKKFTEWGWIDAQTAANDFDALFEGEPRHCNITWKANGTILTILLQELLKQSYIERQIGCTAKSLVKQQFGKTANSDRKRLDNISEKKIELTLLILDINNPLPEPRRRYGIEEDDIKDTTLQEVYAGKLRSTKGI